MMDSKKSFIEGINRRASLVTGAGRDDMETRREGGPACARECYMFRERGEAKGSIPLSNANLTPPVYQIVLILLHQMVPEERFKELRVRSCDGVPNPRSCRNLSRRGEISPRRYITV